MNTPILPAGAAVDLLPSRWLHTIVMAVATFSVFSLLFFSNIASLYATSTIIGIAASFVFIGALKHIRQYFSFKWLTLLVVLCFFLQNMPQSGWFEDIFSPHHSNSIFFTVFISLGIVMAALAVGMWFCLKHEALGSSQDYKSLGRTLGRSAYWLRISSVILMGLTMSATTIIWQYFTFLGGSQATYMHYIMILKVVMSISYAFLVAAVWLVKSTKKVLIGGTSVIMILFLINLFTMDSYQAYFIFTVIGLSLLFPLLVLGYTNIIGTVPYKWVGVSYAIPAFMVSIFNFIESLMNASASNTLLNQPDKSVAAAQYLLFSKHSLSVAISFLLVAIIAISFSPKKTKTEFY